jgi:putative transposase
LRTDNGAEFPGRRVRAVAKISGIAIKYTSILASPIRTPTIERLNRTFREDVLDSHLFLRLEDVREAAHWWIIKYNEQRPHDSLGDLTPCECRQRIVGSSTFEMFA